MVEVKMENELVKTPVKVKKSVERAPRKHRGHPATENGWSPVGVVGTVDGVTWVLYAHRDNPHGWRNMKLAAKGWAPNKANYWFGWSGEEMRIAVSKDIRLMRVNRPGLLDKLEAFLQDLSHL
jgi:hypothetical protein